MGQISMEILRRTGSALSGNQQVVDLIARVTRVSVETMEIVEAMKEAKRTAEA